MTPGRIRVLHSLACVTYGGVEQRRLVLARELDPARYEQRVMAREVNGHVARELESCGVRVIDVGGARTLFHPGAFSRGIAEARRFRPHIVHGAVFEGVGLAVCAGRIAGARVVVEETSYASNRTRRGHALFRAFVAASDACIAVSPAVGQALLTMTGVPRHKIRVITNGIFAPELPPRDERPLVREKLGLPRDAFIVGSVGRMDNDCKGYPDLIRAIKLLAQQIPSALLLLVGDGREQRALQTFARELDVAERVVFTGQRADVGTMYAAMDLFALASVREAFGLVLVEAMFAELPVIATAVGGIRDIVVHDKTGLLVPPRNPAAFAEAILRLHVDAELRASLGAAGHARADEHFGARRYARDIDAFYRNLLASEVDGPAGVSHTSQRSSGHPSPGR